MRGGRATWLVRTLHDADPPRLPPDEYPAVNWQLWCSDIELLMDGGGGRACKRRRQPRARRAARAAAATAAAQAGRELACSSAEGFPLPGWAGNAGGMWQLKSGGGGAMRPAGARLGDTAQAGGSSKGDAPAGSRCCMDALLKQGAQPTKQQQVRRHRWLSMVDHGSAQWPARSLGAAGSGTGTAPGAPLRLAR